MGLSSNSPELQQLIDTMDRTIGPGDVGNLTERVKESLIRFSRQPTTLPDSLTRAADGHYARRLLHRNPQLGYTMVVMTWGPGQATQLHDHAGMWCVECVLDGKLEVTQYDVVERDGDRYRFRARKKVRAEVGNAGCLIPPYEYHVLANALSDRNTVTLHVYGGEMNSCNLYYPEDAGWWQRSSKRLDYDN